MFKIMCLHVRDSVPMPSEVRGAWAARLLAVASGAHSARRDPRTRYAAMLWTQAWPDVSATGKSPWPARVSPPPSGTRQRQSSVPPLLSAAAAAAAAAAAGCRSGAPECCSKSGSGRRRQPAYGKTSGFIPTTVQTGPRRMSAGLAPAQPREARGGQRMSCIRCPDSCDHVTVNPSM